MDRVGTTATQGMAALAAGAMLCALATPLQAQVLEIGDDGAVTRIGGGWPEPAAPAPAASAPVAWRAAFEAAGRETDLSPEFLIAVARSESGLDAKAVSPKGAIGLMQLMPETARQLGVDPHDPAQNIRGGARYLKAQLDRFDGSIDLALAAYNAGPGRVVQYGGVPPFRETQAYVGRNLDRLAHAAGADPQGPTQ